MNSSLINNLIPYLEESSKAGARFYVQKPGRGVAALRFDPSQLRSREGIRLIQYLVETEKSGNKIYIKKPDDELKRLSLLGEIDEKSRKKVAINPSHFSSLSTKIS